MRLLTNYKLFKESIDSEKSVYTNSNLVKEICVAMLLINNDFLDNILDKGLKSRYTTNTHTFINDLKTLVLGNNRLRLGMFTNNGCVEDKDLSKVNRFFDTLDFDIEKNWNVLVNSRVEARNIIDKLLPNEKLSPDRIKVLYWIGPNKTEQHKEDLVIELTEGVQKVFYIDRNLTSAKTASFNTFGDILIGNEMDNLFGEANISKWNKLVQEWVKNIYENATKNIQLHIEKFIQFNRVDNLTWFDYFKIKHSDPKFKILGEHIKEFDKNIVSFKDLMKEIWKHKEFCFQDTAKVEKNWNDIKNNILNSRILEHLLTESLLKNNKSDIEKVEDGLKIAKGNVKMKFLKIIIDKLDCSELDTYYLGDNGHLFYQVPSRQFFRDYYEDINILFDYHVKLNTDEPDDFKIKIIMELDKEPLLECVVRVVFAGGDINSKLSSKYKFTLDDKFNYKISKKKENGK
jgi:hypothetical protein